MLIFDKGLRIVFIDDLGVRKSGIIKCQLAPVKRNSCYLVNAYECGKLSDGSFMVLESQILQVLIKDTYGFDVWVRLDDLYSSYPNGTIIRPVTRYKYNAERNALKAAINLEYGYFANDEKAVKYAMWEWKITPKKVIFNGPATIVIWQDGTKTIVKKSEDDTDDREKAIMYAILKKEFGSRAKMNRYLKQFQEDNKDEKKEN